MDEIGLGRKEWTSEEGEEISYLVIIVSQLLSFLNIILQILLEPRRYIEAKWKTYSFTNNESSSSSCGRGIAPPKACLIYITSGGCLAIVVKSYSI